MAQVTTDYINEDEWTLVTKLNNYYNRARNKKRRMLENWNRNYMMCNNKMYSDMRTNWMPSLTDSEVYPILSTLVAWMTDQNAMFTITPSASPHDPLYVYQQHLGETLQLLLESNWNVLDYDRAVSMVLWDAALYGAGIFKAVWDQAIDEGQGNAKLCRVDPWTFYPDPNATALEDAEYFFEVRKMSFEEIERRYPQVAPRLIQEAAMAGSSDTERDTRIDPARGSNYPKANPGVLPGGSNTSYGLPGQGRTYTEDEESITVYECWLRQNTNIEQTATSDQWALANEDNFNPDDQVQEVVYDEWRVVVFAGGIILLDELATDLWEYNCHPYSRFVFEDLGDFWPTPLATHLAPCQIAINRLLSSMQQNAELCGNPIFMDPKTSGISRTAIINRPGQRLSIDASSTMSSSAGNAPQWLTPPSMPQEVGQLVDFWIERMEHISGLSAMQKGHAPSGRTSQQALNAIQEAGMVRVRSGLRFLESSLREVGMLLVALVVQNFTTPRVVNIAGADGAQSTISLNSQPFYVADFEGQKAPMKFSLLVNSGSANPTSRQARIAEADTLYGMHAIDRKAVLEIHRFPHADEITQRMDQMEMIAAKQGPTHREATRTKKP